MTNQRTPKLIANAIKEMVKTLTSVKECIDGKDPVKLRNLRGDIETLETAVKNVGLVDYLDKSQEFAAPPSIGGMDILRCKLCRCDHLNQPLKSYTEDGLPHPIYTHWYTCPMADAPVGVYIAGDSDVLIDDRVIEELQLCAAAQRWFVALFNHQSNAINRFWKTNEFPKDKLASRALLEWAEKRQDRGEFQALDWLIDDMVKEVQPPPVVRLPLAQVPDTAPIFESQK